MTQTGVELALPKNPSNTTSVLPEMIEGQSNVLYGVPDDVLLLLKQYDFSDHIQPTYTVTGSPNGLHFICVWPTKESKLGDKVLQDIMKIHQIYDVKTAEIGCQTDDLSDVPIEYPDYQNHEELDIEIEKTEAEMECSKSNSKISIASADSGHQPSDPETDIKKSKDIDDVSDIEEIDDPVEPIHSIENIVSESPEPKHKIVRPGFTDFTRFEQERTSRPSNTEYGSIERLRNMQHNISFAPQFNNMPYSGLALLNQQAALRNAHQMQIQNNTSAAIIPKTEYSQSVPQLNSIGEPNVRQHLNEIYRKYNIVPKRIQGGTLEEVLRPPMKSQGHRTAHQIHLMRRMREVSSKMNLTDCANPNYEDAVSVLLDSFEITAPYVNAPEYRRKMNFLLRKRINNRRWFLRKKAKGASMSDQMDMDTKTSAPVHPPANHDPSGQPTQHLRDFSAHFNPALMAAALAQRNSIPSAHASGTPSGPLIGGTPMIDHTAQKVDLTV
jgi:hypothetical protein